jgi:hypothetical protein
MILNSILQGAFRRFMSSLVLAGCFCVCALPAGLFPQTAVFTGAPIALGNGFNGPFGVAVDGSGNVYVADTSRIAISGPRSSGRSGCAPFAAALSPRKPVSSSGGSYGFVCPAQSLRIFIPAGANSPPACSFMRSVARGAVGARPADGYSFHGAFALDGAHR